MKESLKALEEAATIQNKKSNDYQNVESRIKQAQYYPHGCATILDLIHSKVLRMYSVMEAMENDKNYQPNFESLEDSAIDLINYGSFFVSYMRGKMEGQDPTRNFLNKKVTETERLWPETFAQVSDNVYVGTDTSLAIKGIVDDAAQYC
jgi:hypothetical protein